MFRAFRFDLHPTAEQAEKLRQFVGVTRLVYNLALEQRATWGRRHRITWAQQSREVTDLRREFDWIAAAPRSAHEQAIRDLDRAFSDFFAGRARFPTHRRKGVHDSFRVQAVNCGVVRRLNAKWGEVQIPCIGWVRIRLTRGVIGVTRNLTIRHDSEGWSVALACEIEHQAPANDQPAVGIDRGVSNTLSLSTGEHFHMPAQAKALAARMARQQRTLARRKRGSRRYARQRQRIAKLHARIGRIRRDFHHRAALIIAQRFGVVALEALNVRAMTASSEGTAEAPGRMVAQKRGLNRAILNQGWRSFETILAYKLEERGGRLAKVPAAYTSQTCAECGVIDAASRKNQATFCCVHCGHEAHADTNAAIEIRRRHAALLGVEGVHSAPAEAPTVGPLAA